LNYLNRLIPLKNLGRHWPRSEVWCCSKLVESVVREGVEALAERDLARVEDPVRVVARQAAAGRVVLAVRVERKVLVEPEADLLGFRELAGSRIRTQEITCQLCR
jgi:hypothetical protein